MNATTKTTLLALLLSLTLVGCATLKPRTPQARNKETVRAFYADVFNRHNVAATPKYMDEDYIQHNPMAPTGRQAFMEFFTAFFAKSPDWHVEIKRMAADGDLVWVHYHAKRSAGDRGMAVVDIFRMRDGKMVEHWDVVQPVPERSANSNTMF